MKLLYLANSVIPSRSANSVHVMKMCRAFSARADEVVLLVPESRQDAAAEALDPYAYYGVANSFSIRRLRLPQGRFGLIRLYRRLLRNVDVVRPDLAYGRDLFGVLAAARKGVPCALELHTTVSERIRHLGPIGRRVEKLAYFILSRSRSYRGTVVISEALARDVAADTPFLSAKPILVAHDGADDPGAIAPRALEGAAFRVGYVGHLYPGKGMEIIPRLAQSMPTAHFHILGGTEKDIAFWKERVTSPNLVFHGHVAPAEVTGYQKSMDVLLAPYQRVVRTSGGGDTNIGKYMSPLKLFEYMAAGKAIVCSDLPVLREILDDSCAVFAPPEDTDAWIRALESLRSEDLRRKLGSAARARFLSRHSWDRRAEDILGYLSEARPGLSTAQKASSVSSHRRITDSTL